MFVLMASVSADEFPGLLLDDLSALPKQVEDVLGGGMLDIQIGGRRRNGPLVLNDQLNQLFSALNKPGITS